MEGNEGGGEDLQVSQEKGGPEPQIKNKRHSRLLRLVLIPYLRKRREIIVWAI